MNSIPNPKQTNPHDVAVAALKQAHEQFGRADEQLARVEQASKLEQDAAPHPSDPQQPYEQFGSGDEELSNLLHDAVRHLANVHTRTRSNVPDAPRVAPADTTFRPSAVNDVLVPAQLWSIGRRAMRAFITLLLVACIGAAGIAWQSYGDAAKEMIAAWAPQLALTSSLPPEKPGLAEQPAPPAVQADAAPTPLAQTAPEDVAPTAAALSPGSAQLLQSMARDLATVGQEIEQLKTSQAQMARANAELAEQLKAAQAQMARANAELAEQLKAAQAQMVRANAELAKQLKASQEQMGRTIAKASEQNLRPKTSAPPPRPIATPTRKPVPKPSSPQATAQPQAEPVSRPLTPQR